MFSSKPKDTPLPPALLNAGPVPPPPPRRVARAAAPSILSSDVVITGSIVSTGDMQIDGRVEGDVHSVGLVIGDKAEIHGEIHAEEVTIRGRVVGRIRARKILLATTSRVEGDILHEAFAVESGAFFEGNCRHSDNPLESVPAPEAAPRAPAPQQTVASVAPRVQAPMPGQATFAPAGSAG